MAYISFQPSDYFNTKLYTGNGSTQSISSVGFQPDWVWIKNRDGTNNHILQDAVRGATKSLESDGTGAETTSSTRVTSFDSDGFSIGSAGTNNTNTNNYVSWNWLANGSGSSNTDGSVTSTVSANTTAGFSIVKWTANLSSAVTVGHGLGTTPSVIIQKAIDQTSGWVVGGFGLDWSGYLSLDGTSAFNNDSNDSSGTGRFFSAGGTEPSSTVFSTNSSALVGSATDIIAYCFAEKKGYSKFSSFIGNGSTDGTFVYTGFRPAFLLLKMSSGVQGWFLVDNKRANPYNPIDGSLHPNSNAAEDTASDFFVDFTSNGFKLRDNDAQLNGSGSTYIYMAFAEHPLVSSNDIPAVAR